MDLVVIGSKNLCLDLGGKVLNRLLPALLRYYKDKRPPPMARKVLDAPIPIRFTHFNNPFYFFKEMIPW
ncbi:hypothetical protein I3500192B8_18020 [Acidaminococcus intestini]